VTMRWGGNLSRKIRKMKEGVEVQKYSGRLNKAFWHGEAERNGVGWDYFPSDAERIGN